MIIVCAPDEQWVELTKSRQDIEWKRVTDCNKFSMTQGADAFFCLKSCGYITDFAKLEKPVFINAVDTTLVELNAPANVIRINGWATFLSRNTWEVAGAIDEKASAILKKLQIKINMVSDEPGFISARIVAMIINEAYFAVSDNVSSRAEIDTAMKLGTHYPYGPFEWATKIGAANILSLLQKLNNTGNRYKPATLLVDEVKGKGE